MALHNNCEKVSKKAFLLCQMLSSLNLISLLNCLWSKNNWNIFILCQTLIEQILKQLENKNQLIEITHAE